MDSQVTSCFFSPLYICLLGVEGVEGISTFPFQPLIDILVSEDAFQAFHHNACLSTLFFTHIMARWRLLTRFWSHIFIAIPPKTV